MQVMDACKLSGESTVLFQEVMYSRQVFSQYYSNSVQSNRERASVFVSLLTHVNM